MTINKRFNLHNTTAEHEARLENVKYSKLFILGNDTPLR